MRKILIGILTILLIVMAVLVITKGLTIGNFKILSVKQIIEGNDKLTAEISETEKLIRSNYPTELETLDSTVSSLLAAKEEYQDLADVSTKSEINNQRFFIFHFPFSFVLIYNHSPLHFIIGYKSPQ